MLSDDDDDTTLAPNDESPISTFARVPRLVEATAKASPPTSTDEATEATLAATAATGAVPFVASSDVMVFLVKSLFVL